MKAIGIVGSPRKHGNTEKLVSHCLQAIVEEGVEIEMIPLAGLKISGCTACGYCQENPGECSIKDDGRPIIERMKAADAIIVGSPVYFGSATALLKGLLERAAYANRGAYAGKVGGPLVVARRAGKNFTFAELSFWFHINGMINPGSTYWNVAIGRKPGDVDGDDEGLNTVWNFGKNVAKMVLKLAE